MVYPAAPTESSISGCGEVVARLVGLWAKCPVCGLYAGCSVCEDRVSAGLDVLSESCKRGEGLGKDWLGILLL